MHTNIKLPNFFVVGAARSATTSLHYILNSHPQIFMCPKEPNYFIFENGFPDIDYPDKWKKHAKDFLPWCLFGQLKNKVLKNISDIYAQECGLYSDKYKVAGRVDCIAKYNNVLSIIDFKTSTKERSDAWNENYYIQGSAYAEMFTELTGIDISQIVILVVTEDGTVQEFIKEKDDFLDALTDSVAEWKKQNETDNTGRPITHN